MCCVATPLLTDTMNGVEDRRGRKLAYASASKQTCVLANQCQQKSRFCTCHCAACMRIAMATSDRLDDVTSEPADVVDLCYGSEGRDVECQQLQIASQHRHHRQCSVACSKSKGTPPSSSVQLPSTFKLSRIKRSCLASSRKRVDKAKKGE